MVEAIFSVLSYFPEKAEKLFSKTAENDRSFSTVDRSFSENDRSFLSFDRSFFRPAHWNILDQKRSVVFVQSIGRL